MAVAQRVGGWGGAEVALAEVAQFASLAAEVGDGMALPSAGGAGGRARELATASVGVGVDVGVVGWVGRCGVVWPGGCVVCACECLIRWVWWVPPTLSHVLSLILSLIISPIISLILFLILSLTLSLFLSQVLSLVLSLMLYLMLYLVLSLILSLIPP